jgi:predicted nucleic-acid-binding protein
VRSLDTNVIVRLIVQDDAPQAKLAAALLDERCFTALTVLAEVEWVLRSTYGMRREAIARMLETFLESPTVEVEEPELTRWAIGRFANGADLADMLHLVASRSSVRFVTFDRGMSKDAGRSAPVEIQLLR